MVAGEGLDLPRSPSPLVSILIAAVGKTELLVSCLQSLERNLPRDVDIETIVVLAEVSAEEAASLEQRVGGVTFVPTPVNLGMAGSINLGRSLATGRYLLVLHDDAEIEPGWLEGLLAAVEAHPMAGAVGSKVLNFDRTVQYVGAVLWQDGWTTPNSFANLSEGRSEFHPVDYCGTSSLLIRADAFDAIGGCDEAFFPAYFVDVNIALGLRQLGRYVLVAPSSVILHHRGASTTALYRQFISGRNHLLFRKKWAAVLPAYEPRPSGGVESAISRALGKAASFATVCAAAQTALPPGAFGFDREAQQLRHFQLSASIQHDYAAFLEARLSAIERRADEADQNVSQMRASHSWRLTAPLRWIRSAVARGRW